jgi:KUP system potassium uptake protein
MPPPPPVAPGIYLSGQQGTVPAALSLNLLHNGVLHRRVALLRVEVERTPYVIESERLSAEEQGHGVVSVTLRFGFAEDPNVMAALRRHGMAFGLDPDAASFFVGRALPVSSIRPDLSGWEEALFGFMANNAVRASDYFRLPPQQVVELGTRVEV